VAVNIRPADEAGWTTAVDCPICLLHRLILLPVSLLPIKWQLSMAVRYISCNHYTSTTIQYILPTWLQRVSVSACDIGRGSLDRCHTCNFISRFCRTTLSRDKIASVTWRVAQLLNSRATSFPIRAALCSVQLCRENAVNADWSITVYATKLHCTTRLVTFAILSCDKVALQNRAIKLQVWHRS